MSLKRILNILAFIAAAFVGLLLLISVLVNINVVQNFLVRRITNTLSSRLHTHVSIQHVNFELFDKFSIQGAFIQDQHQDTLLYAQHLDLNVTDFFFLRNRTVLWYVGLQHAQLNLKRSATDSVWNYQFILDAFSSGSSSSSSSQPPNLDLRKVDLRDIRVNKSDAYLGQDLKLSADRIQIDAQAIDLRKNRYIIRSIHLQHPLVALINYPAGKPLDTSVQHSSTAVDTGSALPSKTLQWNPEHMVLQVKSLTIHQGGFALLDQQDIHVLPYFDPSHIVVYDVNAELKNTHMLNDSIFSDVHLQAKERSGIEIKNLSCHYKVSPVIMEFSNLDLTTNHSHVSNYYSMTFGDFSDLNSYIHNVVMHAHFQDARISSDDIAYFAPPLKDWKKTIILKGQASGSVDNLQSDNLQIKAGQSTQFSGQFSMSGLPNMNETFMDFRTRNMITSGKDLHVFIPALAKIPSLDLNALSKIRFKGSFTGFLHDFVAYGDFQTNLGYLHSDLNMKLHGSHQVPVYSGNIATKSFDLGQLLQVSSLGPVTLNARINGEGFDFNTLKADLNAQIDALTLNGYTYQNIKTNGNFNKKLFDGLLLVQDPNLAMNFSGTIDFNDSLPKFNFQSYVLNSDLRAMKLTDDSITFRGKLDLNFSGNSIDNFMGDARLHDISLYRNQHRIEFDSLAIHASPDSLGKRLTFIGNELQGSIQGHYNLSELPAALLQSLHLYFPSLIPVRATNPYAEDFTFNVKLGNAEKLFKEFIPQLSGLNDAVFAGAMHSSNHRFSITASIPDLGYTTYGFKDIAVDAEAYDTGLVVKADLGEVSNHDSLLLPSTSLIAHALKDTTLLHFRTSAASTLNNADLNARVITLPAAYQINILNSDLVINDKTWHISPDNAFLLARNKVQIHHFSIVHNEQEINLSSLPDDTSSSFDIQLNNLNIQDFSQIFLSQTRLEGLANGTLHVRDPLGHFKVDGVVQATQFRMNNDSIGLVRANVSYAKDSSMLNWNLIKDDDALNHFSLQGSLGLGTRYNQLIGTIQLSHTDIQILEPWIQDYVSGLHGFASGTIALSGTREAPMATGQVMLDSVVLKVNYLGTTYRFNHQLVHFEPDQIAVQNMILYDSYGNQAVLNGALQHQHFSNLYFNFKLHTSNFRFLHTSALDNPLFFGDVFAGGTVDFYGPLKDMQMVADVTSERMSHLYLPMSDSKDIGKHDFVIFKQYGKELNYKPRTAQQVNLTLHINASVNPNARIDVILDPTTGDELTTTGTGSLQMTVNLNGNFNMYGNYTIDQGKYTFSLKGLFERDFNIDKGSIISWSGNPSDANVNISATYNVPGGASLYDLIAGETQSAGITLSDEDKRLIREREKVNVILMLKGALMHPDISYDIVLPQTGINTGSYAMSKLEQIKQNPNDLLTQVTSLLAFGQFWSQSNTGANSGLLRSGGLSGAGQLVSSQVSGVLNNLLGNALRNIGVDFTMNYNAYSTSGDYGALQRNDVQFNLSKNLFNNRVRLEVGPSIDWGRSNTSGPAVNNSYFAGDFRFDYLITPDGRIRFFAFSQSNYDVLIDRNLTRGGIGISYNRQFDAWKDLFQGKKQRMILDSLRMLQLKRLQSEERKNRIKAKNARRKERYEDKKERMSADLKRTHGVPSEEQKQQNGS